MNAKKIRPKRALEIQKLVPLLLVLGLLLITNVNAETLLNSEEILLEANIAYANEFEMIGGTSVVVTPGVLKTVQYNLVGNSMVNMTITSNNGESTNMRLKHISKAHYLPYTMYFDYKTELGGENLVVVENGVSKPINGFSGGQYNLNGSFTILISDSASVPSGVYEDIITFTLTAN
ncbi:MAG: hypothetical protein WCY78_06165 [Sphaerochaetaceae bacterium]